MLFLVRKQKINSTCSLQNSSSHRSHFDFERTPMKHLFQRAQMMMMMNAVAVVVVGAAATTVATVATIIAFRVDPRLGG